MLLPWQLHAAGDVLTRAPGHSVSFLGAILGWGDCEWAGGESSCAPKRLPKSTFLRHAFSSCLPPAAPVQSFQLGSVCHFKY